MSEIELIVKEDSVGNPMDGRDAVLSERLGKEIEFNDEKLGGPLTDNELMPKSILEKLVVSALARSLVDIPPGVINVGVFKLGAVKLGAVRLTETEGSEKPVDSVADETVGNSGDKVGNEVEGMVRLPGDSVTDNEPIPDVLGNVTPGRDMLPVDSVGRTELTLGVPSDMLSDVAPGRADVGTSTEVASGIRSDTLNVPVVNTVTVNGGGIYVTVTEPSQTGR